MLDRMKITGDGGRSGELLFFNHDNSLLLKTLSDRDVKGFKKMAYDYFDYIMDEQNEDTMIVKIYGLYAF